MLRQVSAPGYQTTSCGLLTLCSEDQKHHGYQTLICLNGIFHVTVYGSITSSFAISLLTFGVMYDDKLQFQWAFMMSE
ncbi:hypothetical protein LXL04_020376 [Taraxacum kok-saghyz]